MNIYKSLYKRNENTAYICLHKTSCINSPIWKISVHSVPKLTEWRPHPYLKDKRRTSPQSTRVVMVMSVRAQEPLAQLDMASLQAQVRVTLIAYHRSMGDGV